jgi:hypothetical protein
MDCFTSFIIWRCHVSRLQRRESANRAVAKERLGSGFRQEKHIDEVFSAVALFGVLSLANYANAHQICKKIHIFHTQAANNGSIHCLKREPVVWDSQKFYGKGKKHSM